MTTLIAILTYLASLGVDLSHFDIHTMVPNDTVYECDGYVTPEATILVCYKERMILVVKKKMAQLPLPNITP